MKVLNLYAGIGGNRKLWEDVDVTAVEINPKIANIYSDFFPKDKMIIDDAHQYLLEHFKEYDFIWSSPPCPTHSRINNVFVKGGQNPIRYPDMKLYEEVILLEHHFEGRFCVENVIAYYEPLIPCLKIDNHWFWTNFHIRSIPKKCREHYGGIEALKKRKGFDIDKYSGIDKEKTLRNCVLPELGLHILKESQRKDQCSLF